LSKTTVPLGRYIYLYILGIINRSVLSINHAAPSKDLLVQASIDGATIDRSCCAIDGWAQASAFKFQGYVNGRFGLWALSMSSNTGHLVIV